MLPRIFDLFVRGERAPGQSEGGLGLGLCLVKNLVAMHDGEVFAKSEGRGAGSEFVVRLRALVGDATPTRPLPRLTTLRVRGAPRRILVVDDNEDASLLLAECLGAVGHDVVVAHDGPAAIDACATFGPEIAVVDIGLPVMDGYELAMRLRERHGRVLRLFALTGYGQQADRERSHAAGFERHFVKPVDVDALALAIAQEPT
jgi:CheY-like chemotaxis protein